MTLRPANYNPRQEEGTSLAEIGPVYAEIELSNYHDIVIDRVKPGWVIHTIKKPALVNSDAFELVISEQIKESLDLFVFEKRTARFPDESVREVEIVGPVEVRFENESTVMTAMVLPDTKEILLGRIARAGLGVFIDPESKRLLVTPYRPIKRVA